jgi:hypothetical protein
MEPTQKNMRQALADAINQAGGPTAVGALFDPPIRPQAVSQWVICPEKRVLGLAAGIRYARTPHELRPDIYPRERDGVPPSVRLRKRA